MYQGTYRLIGTEMSMFSRKLEAQLRYQQIPYQWQYTSLGEPSEEQKRAGTRFIPLLKTPDGWLLSDTIAIGPMLSQRFHRIPVIPHTPVQRAACFIIEDTLNHWFARHALHSRWCYDDTVVAAGRGFAINGVLQQPINAVLSPAQEQQIANTGIIMRDSFGLAACEIQGAGVAQRQAIKDDFNTMMALFKQHFDAHAFLLGERACLADFALAGPAKAHFLTDLEPSRWLEEQQNTPMLAAFVERIMNPTETNASYYPDDQLPPTLLAILSHAKANYQVFANASIRAAASGDKFFTLSLGNDTFTARSMKRLDKARLHVRDEINGLAIAQSPLHSLGITDYYQPAALV
jgi:glutathione S-transferase